MKFRFTASNLEVVVPRSVKFGIVPQDVDVLARNEKVKGQL